MGTKTIVAILAVFAVLLPIVASAATPIQAQEICTGRVIIVHGYGHAYILAGVNPCAYERVDQEYQSRIANLNGDQSWVAQMRHQAAVERNASMSSTYREIGCNELGGYYHQLAESYTGQYQPLLLVFDQGGFLISQQVIDPDNLDDTSDHVFRGCAPSTVPCPSAVQPTPSRNNTLAMVGAFVFGAMVDHQFNGSDHHDGHRQLIAVRPFFDGGHRRR